MAKPLIIPLFIPHAGCPHHCSFCDQTAITGKSPSLPDLKQIQRVVDSYLPYKGSRDRVELAFFGGNFLGLAPSAILELLSAAGNLHDQQKIDSIRFSTRPDTITPERLALIGPYPVSVVEIGAQSMDDKVLDCSLRGHTARHTEQAVALLQKNHFTVGLQMMVGLMGDTTETAVESARKMADLSPAFVRIYPLIVLESSRMAQWYYQKAYVPLSLEKSVTLVKEIYKIFAQKHIPVIRMGLQTSDILEQSSAVVAGPWHPAFGHLVLSELYFDKACDLIDRSQEMIKKIVLKVHPSSESRMRGNKNENIRKLHIRYPEMSFSIKPDPLTALDEVVLSR